MEQQVYDNRDFIFRRKQKPKQSEGFITLVSVLLIGAVGSAIALSVLLISIATSRTSFALIQSSQAKALANACSEDALQQIRNSISFIGNGNLIFSTGTCTYSVTNSGGQARTVTTTGTVGAIVRKVTIAITAINPTITVSSWQEVQ